MGKLDTIRLAVFAILLTSIACIPARCGEMAQVQAGAVSYFSAKGKAEAETLRIPAPPIQILLATDVNPSRDVAARNWRAPFCAAWDDGCTGCERASPNSPITCDDLRATRATDQIFCVPRAVKCRRAQDELRFCMSGGRKDTLVLDGKPFKNFDSSYEAHWVYIWGQDGANGTWQVELAEEASLSARRANDPIIDKSNLTEDVDYFCDQPQIDAQINPRP